MANYTLNVGGVFPDGTSLGTYPVTRWREDQLPPVGAPLGASINSQTVASGTVTFTGLTAGVDYFATDSLGSRYMRFSVGADTTGPSSAAPVNLLASSYVPILRTTTRLNTPTVAGGTYLMIPGLADQTTAAAITALNTAYPWLLNWYGADHVPPPGKLTKLRVSGSVGVAGNPACTYTIGLYPFTVSAGNIVAGTLVPGSSKAIAIAGAQAQTNTPGQGLDFTPPADGAYLCGIVVNASAGAAVDVHAVVERHFA